MPKLEEINKTTVLEAINKSKRISQDKATIRNLKKVLNMRQRL